MDLIQLKIDKLILMGGTLFSANYYFFYLDTQTIESGLVAITFSIIVFFNSLNNRLFFGARVDGTVICEGIVGVTGVALMFGHTFYDINYSSERLHVMLYALFATFLVSLGNMISARCSTRNIPTLTSTSISKKKITN